MKVNTKPAFLYHSPTDSIHVVTLSSAEDFDGFLSFLENCIYNRRGAWVLDLTNAPHFSTEQRTKLMSIEQRTKLNTLFKCHESAIQKSWASIGFVNRSILGSIMLKSALLSSVTPVPSKVFFSLDNAIDWSLLQMTAKYREYFAQNEL